MDCDKYIDTEKTDEIPLFYNAKVFNKIISDLSQPYINIEVDKVVGIEARVFILGGGMARELKSGFVAISKSSKLKQEISRSRDCWSTVTV